MSRNKSEEWPTTPDDIGMTKPSERAVSPVPSLDNVSVLEAKNALVERALNDTGETGPLGLGRYQWCIFVLCGFGYFLDLMWAQSLGLAVGPLATEFGIGPERSSDLFTVFNAGLTAGAFTWGVLVDTLGRKWSFNLTCFITSVFGLALGGSNNFTTLLALTFFCGFGLGGNIPIDATILLEFLPVKSRWLLVALSMFQPIGVVVCSLIAWGLVPKYTCDAGLEGCSLVAAGEACCEKGDNMGWRYLFYTLGAITLLCFFCRFVIFTFRESPKFLVSKGRDEEAITIVHQIAKFNKTSSSLAIESFYDLERKVSHGTQSDSDRSTPELESGVNDPLSKNRAVPKKLYDLSHLKILFSSWKIGLLTLLVFLIYMSDYWAFTVAGSFLPQILAQKGAARDISIDETYRNYVIIYIFGIPGVAIGVLFTFIPRFGMRLTMILSFILMGVSLFLFAVIDSQTANVAFNALEYAFQSTANAVLYAYAPQLFVTAVRGTAVGSASTLGRITGIVAPKIAGHLYESSGVNSVLYLGGGGALLAAVASILLPEVKGRTVY